MSDIVDPFAGKILLSKKETRAALGGMCNATYYNLVKLGRLRVVHVTGRAATPVEDVKAEPARAIAAANKAKGTA